MKKTLLLMLVIVLLCFMVPKTLQAASMQEAVASEDSLLVKIQEGLEYFFAFRLENKVQVLEKHAERRLVKAQEYVEKKNEEKVQNTLQQYSRIKEKQNALLEKGGNEGALERVAQRTVEQQKTMEQIKLRVEGETKQNVVQVQERVVNQVAKNIIEVNGPEGATEFLNQAAHVWAPGTGPGGEAGVVYAGGGKLIYAPGTESGGSGGQAGVVIEGGEMRFAPGTSGGDGSGGPAVQDIKTVEVKTDGGEGGSGAGGANNGAGAVMDGGGRGAVESQPADPGQDDTRVWIDP